MEGLVELTEKQHFDNIAFFFFLAELRLHIFVVILMQKYITPSVAFTNWWNTIGFCSHFHLKA